MTYQDITSGKLLLETEVIKYIINLLTNELIN